MNWREANVVGLMAAEKAHTRLAVEPTAYPVDVNRAIHAADLALMERPLPTLFGIYLQSPGSSGILINSTMARATRRHTAAHELGHHVLRHGSDPARRCAIPADGSSAAPSGGGRERRIQRQGDAEMAAEAFAAWFLMPRKAIRSALAHLGLGVVSSAADAYQLSLRLGVTFRGMCRHLANARFADADTTARWASIQPGRIKRALADSGGLRLESTMEADVWDLRLDRGSRVEATVGDHLIAPSSFAPLVEQFDNLAIVAKADKTVSVQCQSVSPAITIAGERPLNLSVGDRPHGVYLPKRNRKSQEKESSV